MVATAVLTLSAQASVAGDATGESTTGSNRYRYYETEFSVTDMDLAALRRRLERFGVQLPFSMSGRLSAEVRIEIPWNAFLEGRAYRLNGRARSGRVALAGVAVEDLSAAVSYADGVLTLEELQFRFPEEGRKAGNVSGAATLQLLPIGELTAAVELDSVPLDQFAEAAALPVGVAGRVSGTARARVALADIAAVGAWRATGNVRVADGRAGELPPLHASTDFRIEEGVLSLSELGGRMENARLKGSGQLQLSESYRYVSDLSLDVRRLDMLNRLAPQIAWPRPFGGRASLSGEFVGTFRPWSLELRGTGAAADLRLGQFKVDSVQFNYGTDSDGGVVEIDQIAARAYGSQVKGSAAIPLFDDRAGSVAFTWQDFDVGRLMDDLRFEDQAAGLVDGSLNVEIPAGELLEYRRWRAQGRLSLRRGQLFGWNLRQLTAQAQLAEQELSVVQFRAGGDDGDLELSGRVKLVAPFEYDGQFDLTNGDLTILNEWPERYRPTVPVAGRVSLQGSFGGQLDPFEFTGRGRGDGRRLRFDNAQLESLRFQFTSDGRELAFDDVQAMLYDGRATGEASIPLNDDVLGSAALQWSGIDAGALLDDLQLVSLPVDLGAAVHGSLNVLMPEGRFPDVDSWTVRSSFNAPSIRANSVPVGNLRGELNHENEVLAYDVQGTVLDGRLRASGQWPTRPGRSDAQGAPTGMLAVEQLQLARLGLVFADQNTMRSLTGTANLSLNLLPAGRRDGSIGEGQFTLVGLEWNGVDLADRLQGQVVLSGDRLELLDLGGSYAGGRLRAAGLLMVRQFDRSTFSVSLSGAESSRVLAVWPDLTSWLNGTIDVQLRGGLGPRSHVTGMASLYDADIGGLRAQIARFPLRGAFDPRRGLAEFTIRGGSAQIARGRVHADLQLTWSRVLDVDGKLTFSRVDLGSLLRELAGSSQAGRGQISGTATLSGRRVRSIHDLTGYIEAELRDTQAMSYPLLDGLVPYLPGVSSSTTFNEGELRSRLAGGLIELERLFLSGDSFQLAATGNLTTTGRLNLDVVASTERLSANRRLARLLLQRMPLALPASVADLAAATNYLEGRVIYLDVGGTIRNPTVRLRPLPILREEVVRFFVKRALSLP